MVYETQKQKIYCTLRETRTHSLRRLAPPPKKKKTKTKQQRTAQTEVPAILHRTHTIISPLSNTGLHQNKSPSFTHPGTHHQRTNIATRTKHTRTPTHRVKVAKTSVSLDRLCASLTLYVIKDRRTNMAYISNVKIGCLTHYKWILMPNNFENQGWLVLILR